MNATDRHALRAGFTIEDYFQPHADQGDREF
jgi:hypothetical protein